MSENEARASEPGWRMWVASPTGRRSLVQTGVAVVLLLATFYPAIAWMVHAWNSDANFSYGYFIPVISLFYVWQNWDRLRSARAEGSWWGLPLLVLSLLVYFVASLLDPPQIYMMALSMVGALASLVILFFGWRTFWLYAFPILYLVVMIPLPKQPTEQYITLPLQRRAARVGAEIIAMFDIPVIRTGNVIQIPSTKLLVEEACSGIRSLFSLGALSIAFVVLLEKRWWERVLLVAITPAIAVLGNVLRVAITGILCEQFGPQMARGGIHEFAGLVLFVFGMLMLFACSWILTVFFPEPEDPELEDPEGDVGDDAPWSEEPPEGAPSEDDGGSARPA